MEGQLNISNFGDTLEVRLRNFPNPHETEMVGGTPVSKWNHPDKSELQDTPPVYRKEKDDEEVTLIKRQDNDAVCGFDIKNWKDHRDFMHFRKEKVVGASNSENGEYNEKKEITDHTKLDAPRM